MSVASEIDRIEQAKEDIKSEIAAKGVSVPSNAKIDDLAQYVAAIPTGGAPTETVTAATLTSGSDYSTTIANYTNGKSIVDVYLNGMRLRADADYTLSSSGVMTLSFTPDAANNEIMIVHRRWD